MSVVLFGCLGRLGIVFDWNGLRLNGLRLNGLSSIEKLMCVVKAGGVTTKTEVIV